MSETTTDHETEPTETETPVEPDQTTPDTEDETEANNAEDPETFPREYVEKLRKEAADARVRAKDRDDLAHRLHGALVTATGRLADADDLDFDEAHLTDTDALNAAIDELLTRKPHLVSRRITGDVGQGAHKDDTAVDLAGMLRRNAS